MKDYSDGRLSALSLRGHRRRLAWAGALRIILAGLIATALVGVFLLVPVFVVRDLVSGDLLAGIKIDGVEVGAPDSIQDTMVRNVSGVVWFIAVLMWAALAGLFSRTWLSRLVFQERLAVYREVYGAQSAHELEKLMLRRRIAGIDGAIQNAQCSADDPD